MALLLITHDLNLVRRFADRVAVMEKGVLVEQGPTAQVIGSPQHPYTQKLVNSRPRATCGQPGERHASSRRRHVQVRLPDAAARHPRLVQERRASRRCEAVDFDLAPGETLGVIGESGSGKTTLALAVLGLMAAPGRDPHRRARPGRGACGSARSMRKRHPGRVPGPAVLAVAAPDGRADRRRRPGDPRAGARRGGAARAHRAGAATTSA